MNIGFISKWPSTNPACRQAGSTPGLGVANVNEKWRVKNKKPDRN